MKFLREKVTIALILVLSSIGCHGPAEPTTPPPPEPPPPAPPSPQVELLELIPSQSSLVFLVDIASLRQTNYGDALIVAVRTLAETSEWEQLAEVDLSNDVERMIFFARVDESTGASGDLTRIMNRISASSTGFVLELSENSMQTPTSCSRSDLDETQMAPVDGPREHSFLARCGRFVFVSCCEEQPLRLTFHDSAAARALQRISAPENGAQRIASVVYGPDALNHATCSSTRVGLTGWQSATADIGEGLTVSGRIHAATPSEAPVLEECIEDGLAEISSFPLLRQFGLGGLLSTVEISRDPADDKDVLISAPLDAGQTEFLMSLVNLLGGGGLP